MHTATWASVTTKNCECRYLEELANDAASAIHFDEITNEYSIHSNDSALIISSLLAGLTTIDAITKKLGNPDYDGHSQSIDREMETRGQILRQHRYLRYERLSDSAYLIVSENPDGTVTWYLQGKPKNSFDCSEVPRKLHPDYRPWWKKLVLWAIGESHRTKP